MAAYGAANLLDQGTKFSGSALTHDVAPASSFGPATGIADYNDTPGQSQRTGRANGQATVLATLRQTSRFAASAATGASSCAGFLILNRGSARLAQVDGLLVGSALFHEVAPSSDFGPATGIPDYLSDSKGVAVGTSTATGSVGSAVVVEGTTAVGASTGTASMGVRRGVDASATGVSSTTGAAKLIHGASGSATGSATATAAHRQRFRVTGLATAGATATGEGLFVTYLRARAEGLSSVSADLLRDAGVTQLTATANGSAASSATLSTRNDDYAPITVDGQVFVSPYQKQSVGFYAASVRSDKTGRWEYSMERNVPLKGSASALGTYVGPEWERPGADVPPPPLGDVNAYRASGSKGDYKLAAAPAPMGYVRSMSLSPPDPSGDNDTRMYIPVQKYSTLKLDFWWLSDIGGLFELRDARGGVIFKVEATSPTWQKVTNTYFHGTDAATLTAVWVGTVASSSAAAEVFMDDFDRSDRPLDDRGWLPITGSLKIDNQVVRYGSRGDGFIAWSGAGVVGLPILSPERTEIATISVDISSLPDRTNRNSGAFAALYIGGFQDQVSTARSDGVAFTLYENGACYLDEYTDTGNQFDIYDFNEDGIPYPRDAPGRLYNMKLDFDPVTRRARAYLDGVEIMSLTVMGPMGPLVGIASDPDDNLVEFGEFFYTELTMDNFTTNLGVSSGPGELTGVIVNVGLPGIKSTPGSSNARFSRKEQ